MSSAQSPYPDEPPPPVRGLTREERGRDVSEAQAEAEAETSTGKRLLKSMSPRFVLSMADGYPVVLKQFIQFCLILIYPAWLFGVLAGGRYVLLRLRRAVGGVLADSVVDEEEPARRLRGKPEEVVGLFRRSTAIDLTVSPAVAVPRQTVTATISGSLDKVRSAKLDWGYTNFFRYHWAGHADSAAAQANDDMWLLGEVGTNYGGDRDSEEWVSVTAADLPIATGELVRWLFRFQSPVVGARIV